MKRMLTDRAGPPGLVVAGHASHVVCSHHRILDGHRVGRRGRRQVTCAKAMPSWDAAFSMVNADYVARQKNSS
jgi:hypothetical protein